MSVSRDARETRETVNGLELRDAPAGSKSPGTLTGYAAIYDKYSCDLGYFREKLSPGCFKRSLQSCDVRALYNHDPDHLLGRTSAGTLRLLEDDTGLRMECDLPDTQLGRDVAELVRSRNLQGQSFSFTTSIDQWDWSGDVALRTVVEVEDLFDVGPVTYPAYEETSVAMRQLRSLREARSKPANVTPLWGIEHERDLARLRLLEVSLSDPFLIP